MSRWTLEHRLSIIAIVVSAVAAVTSSVVSLRAADQARDESRRALDFQAEVRRANQAEQVVFVRAGAGAVAQNFSRLPVQRLTVHLFFQDGSRISVSGGNIPPCQQAVTSHLIVTGMSIREKGEAAVLARAIAARSTPDYSVISFSDMADQQWIREFVGPLFSLEDWGPSRIRFRTKADTFPLEKAAWLKVDQVETTRIPDC
jgi:hypothetical protein